jgi:hypothetical protein
MPRLPAETIDSIVDFHHSDEEALKACSLVCRNWLPASRFHLFGSVDVKHSNVHSFVKLLASPSSTITNCVHTLVIEAVCAFDVIAPYFKDMVAVTSITLCEWPVGSVSEECLSRGFGRIGNMDLSGIYYDFRFFRVPSGIHTR